MADQTSKHASNTAGQQRKAVNVQRARLRTIQRVSVVLTAISSVVLFFAPSDALCVAAIACAGAGLAATGLLVAAEKEGA